MFRYIHTYLAIFVSFDCVDTKMRDRRGQVTLLNCDCRARQRPSTYNAASLLLFLDAKANSAPIMPANRIKANTSTDTTEMVRTIQAESKECKLHIYI